MPRYWKEALDPHRHRDYMETSWIGGIPVNPQPDHLIRKWVYFVEVCSFTFQFHSIQQIEACLAYFSQKIHPSTRTKGNELEHYWQQWYERLPQWLFTETKRKRVVKALRQALITFHSEE